MQEQTVYEAVGGDEFFHDLTRRFYGRVAEDPVLRPLYPEDLEPGRRHLALFLVQYWGGPTTYSDERGHPRLRARHLPFPIGEREAQHWYGHMRASVLEADLAADVEGQLLTYFAQAADFMRNQPG